VILLFNIKACDIFLIMSAEWDTIIVGAGAGGLTAAAKLVKAGLRVLVLERNLHPGGTAYVYTRRGFTFPMGPLGFTTPHLIRNTIRDLDQDKDLEFLRVHYRIKAFNLEISISSSFLNIVKDLSELFPSEAQTIKKFFQDMEEISSALESPDDDKNRLLLKRVAQTSSSGYLDGLVKDGRLRRILGSQGTREPNSGLPLLAAMWNIISNEGIWYPKEGMRSLLEGLAVAVTGHHRNGRILNGKSKGEGKQEGFGEIKLGTEVREIRVEKSKVLGVALGDGSKIDSASIISNADYKTTFTKLINPQKIPVEWYQAVVNARQTRSIFQVCLGLDKSKADLSSFEKASRFIYKRNQWDPQRKEELDWNEKEIYPEALASQELEISLWSKEDRMLAPEGGGVIVIRTEAEHSHFSRYRPIWGKRLPDYYDYKTRLSKALIQEANNLIPGIERAVLVADVATPLTFEERGGRSEGAVAGWSWDYRDFRDYRPRELVRTPIKGLYMAGYQAFSAIFMGGIPTAVESGKRAAEAVLQNADPAEAILIPCAK
jgi:all-trans-retinol 13,14-reductase